MRWYGRLERSSEIAFVRRRGRRSATENLTAYASPAPQGSSRVAVAASKAVGCAVVRNRLRRRVRGALDGLHPPQTAVRLFVVLKPPAAKVTYGRLAADVALALGRATGSP